MKKLPIVIIIILLALFSLILANKIQGSVIIHEKKLVTKIIDGDTIIINGGRTIRLLGIDTDERGGLCFAKAKERLEALILNKEVYISSDREDRDIYGRLLRYIFLDNENINVLMVKEGLAIARLNGYERYSKEITKAEELAMSKKIGCKWAN